MLTRTALFGFVLAATLITPARAQDNPRKVVSSDEISCEYQYSLSKLPGSATDSDEGWKTPYRLRVQKMECNGKDMRARDEDVDVKYRQAVIKTSVIGELMVLVFVSADGTKIKLETLLKPSQIKQIKKLTWVQVLGAN